MKKTFHITGVGVDITEAKRFRTLLKQKKLHTLSKLFSSLELDYCLSYKDPAPHLAGTFAAKEASQKAMGDFSSPPHLLEIRRTKDGKPEVWVSGKRSKYLLISISHTLDTAIAVAYNQ